MRMKATLIGGILSVLVVVPAIAHHGWDGNNEEVTMTGTVSAPISLSGPHASMKLTDESGQQWDITLAPAPRTHRAGLSEDLIPMGATVTVLGSRNDDPTDFEIKTRRVTYAGQDYDVYPVRR